MQHYDIVYMCDNNIHSFLGGTERSVQIILESQSLKRKVALIQPGAEKGKDTKYDEYNQSQYIYAKALFKHPIDFVKYILFVRKILKENTMDIIHVQAHVAFYIVGFLLDIHAIKKEFTLIYTDRGLYTKYNFLYRGLFIHFLKYADILVTTTGFNQRKWKAVLQHRKTTKNIEYRIIENTAGENYANIQQSKHQGQTGVLTIGFAGRYCGWKGWPLAEAICEAVHEKDSNIRFRMAVAGNSEKDIQKIQEMFRGLQEYCGDVFRGYLNLPTSEMDKFYKDIDIFILTSNPDSESFGRTVVEAMCMRTAVLLTKAGGAEEVVSDRECICNTVKDFVDKVIEMRDNRLLLDERKNRNCQRVHGVYSLKNNLEKHEELYLDTEKKFWEEDRKRVG